jgi:23S rRNA-/tRNA-specific pseudouridylate synthase
MPVHACGNFLYNTLINVVNLELNYKDLKTVHRLDRQTSGIVFFAKKDTSSNEFREALIDNKISKVYYARVKGDFRKACTQGTTQDKSQDKSQDQEDKP